VITLKFISYNSIADSSVSIDNLDEIKELHLDDYFLIQSNGKTFKVCLRDLIKYTFLYNNNMEPVNKELFDAVIADHIKDFQAAVDEVFTKK
jgi:hypothetical protein